MKINSQKCPDEVAIMSYSYNLTGTLLVGVGRLYTWKMFLNLCDKLTAKINGDLVFNKSKSY